jgi:hypothetical protein
VTTKNLLLLGWIAGAASVLAACGSDDARGARLIPSDSGPVAAQSAATGKSETRAGKQAPKYIRGIYLNAYGAGSKARLAKLIALADQTELNTFVIDFKDEKGIHYPSEIALAKELAQPGEITLRNPRAILDTLHAHGIWVVARIVVFKDPVLSKARPQWSIKKPDGGLWQDKAGNTWVSSWEPEVWNHNIALAEEVVKLGVDEVQFDYVRFPEPFPSLPTQVHPKAKGERSEAIAMFLNEAKKRIHPLGAVVAADVFGLSPADPRDVNIGQQWETLSAVADHILPMVYPSHFLPVHLPNVPRPNRAPYETIYKSMGMATIRTERLRASGVNTARVIPWLQAFSAPWVDKNFQYGPEQAAAQIKATYDVGLEDWIFWHPGSKYEHVAAAFARENETRAKPFKAPEELVRLVDLYDKQGAKAARDRAGAAR